MIVCYHQFIVYCQVDADEKMGLRRRKADTKLTGFALLALLGLVLVATACGDPTARPNATNSGTIGIPDPTVTPPFRALAGDPTATPTLERGVLLPSAT